jgi:predicted metal-binding membrane protein
MAVAGALPTEPGRAVDLRPVLVIVVAAWTALVVIDASGAASAFHHHALIEGGLPPWAAIPRFLLAWAVMVAAMMLPASLPTVRSLVADAGLTGSIGAELGFVAGFLAIWAGFGLAAFLGDMVVHRVVDSTSWLASRPWLIEAGVLALAGGYQFAPRKRRDLERCRQPREHASAAEPSLGGAVEFGLRHGIACVGASWALMLLMFAEGFGGLAWMIALTSVMALETALPLPRRLSSIVGVGLILVSIATLAGPTAF